MIGTEEERNDEEPVLKVTDRRKFNPDGSVREGVTIEKEEPVLSVSPEEAVIDVEAPKTDKQVISPEREEPDFDEEKETSNPASFINFLSTLVTNAAASLGAMPHPVTGQKTVDLETAKYWIDVLSMLHKKTKGN